MIYLMPLALLPAIVLCVYIYKKDKADKEPPKLLATLLLAGVGVALIAMLVEMALGALLNAAFGLTGDYDGSGDLSAFSGRLYYFIEAFLIVAPAEEFFKWLFTWKITAKNKNFNSLFDGVIYCVFTSLGFAAFENVMYVFQYGVSAALMRAVTAVPGHMFFAIIMGYFYSMWHLQYQAKHLESECVRLNYMKQPAASAFNTRAPLFKSIVLPIAVHGAYDYCCFVGTVLSTIIFYVLLIGLYVYCFTLVKKQSDKDTFSGRLALGMVIWKYPELNETLPQETINYVRGVQPLQTNAYTQQTNAYPQQTGSYPQQTNTYTRQATGYPYPQTNSYAQPQSGAYAQPRTAPYPQQTSGYTQQPNAYAQQQSRGYAQPSANPYSQQANPYPQQTNPYSQQTNPYSQQANPYAQRPEPPAAPDNNP
ncbi:MAG: PrsW family intramembrane metalloprotease [Clostridia bacterium]|nr:PrsW family intramembrane metalloprotease [Clostridia bacterium]